MIKKILHKKIKRINLKNKKYKIIRTFIFNFIN